MKKTSLIKIVCIVVIAACAFPIVVQAGGSTQELVITDEMSAEEPEKDDQGIETPSPETADMEKPSAELKAVNSPSPKRLPQLNESNCFSNILLLLGINCLILFVILIYPKRNEAEL